MYYCGWDGGGSKTGVCITDPAGVVLAQASFGPLNPNGTSPEEIKNTVRDCCDFMNAQPGGLSACLGLIIGIAGVSNRNAAEMVENTVRLCGYTNNLKLMGDQEIALAGAVNGPGAILIAGTGSVCFGRDPAGAAIRSGGFGYLIDDAGGGYAIARDILIAVTHAMDGRGPDTCLTEAVFGFLQISGLRDLITWLYAPETGKKQIASLAPLLLPALSKGDAVARSIARKTACDLSALVIAAFRKADMQTGEVALTGSIITYYDDIREQTITEIRQALPLVKVGFPRRSAAEGAAELARENFPYA